MTKARSYCCKLLLKTTEEETDRNRLKAYYGGEDIFDLLLTGFGTSLVKKWDSDTCLMSSLEALGCSYVAKPLAKINVIG